MKWFVPSELVNELEAALLRIPKDLRTWKREIKKLSRKRTIKSKKIKQEYHHDYSYYCGKVAAYLYVLTELDDHKFVKKYEKKHKVKYFPEQNKMTFTP